MTTFQPVTIADAYVLTDLSRSTFVESFGPFNTAEDMEIYLGQSMTLEKLCTEIQEPGSSFFFAWYGGELAGYVKLKSTPHPDAPAGASAIEIERIYVKSRHQNKGIGADILRFCVSHACEKGSQCIWLGVWEHNAGAIRFYEKWGFTIYGRHDFLLGNDLQTDILMKYYVDAK